MAARFDDTTKRVQSVEKLRQTCEPIGLISGKLVRVEAARTSAVQGNDVVVIPVVFENASWDLKVSLDSQRRVAGLLITPGSGAGWEPPPYGRGQSIEAAIKVGPRALNGELLLPFGKGPFPAVVLVHGSGPHDADETIWRSFTNSSGGPPELPASLKTRMAARGVMARRPYLQGFYNGDPTCGGGPGAG